MKYTKLEIQLSMHLCDYNEVIQYIIYGYN